MPRRRLDPSDPDKLQHYVAVYFSTRDLEVIDRVAMAYGLKRSGAVRLMMRQGATRYDTYKDQEGE